MKGREDRVDAMKMRASSEILSTVETSEPIDRKLKTKELRQLPLFFLMSFGHCGIDWLHSLLDSHPEILIMPAFSFYRSWKIIGAHNATTAKQMALRWQKYIEEHGGLQVKRRRLFHNPGESERFFPRFQEILESCGIGYANVFWAIHQAYAEAKQVDISKIRIVVAQEHLPFYFEQMLSDFPHAGFLMIMRDPRAVMAGSFHGITKAIGHLPDYSFNLITEFTMHAKNMWSKHRIRLGDRLKVVRNEDLHEDLEKHMRDLARWLGVGFQESMIRSTFSGIEWVGESSYIEEEEKYPEPLEIYYLPENVKKRWLQELSTREILMIEFLTRELMQAFGYERMTEDTWVTRIKGFLIYILPHRGLFKKWLRSYPHLEEFKRVSRNLDKGIKGRIWKVLPRPVKFLNVLLHSVFSRVRILFLPGDPRRKYV